VSLSKISRCKSTVQKVTDVTEMQSLKTMIKMLIKALCTKPAIMVHVTHHSHMEKMNNPRMGGKMSVSKI